MRTILFRGKEFSGAINHSWLFGSLDTTEKECPSIIYIDKFGNRCRVFLDPKTVGQYTGLTDKNGKKIFEGDIIRYADNDEYEMYLESLEFPEEYEGADFSRMWTVDEVVYGDKIGYPAFDLNAHDFECNGLAELSESGGQWFYEVIGNIYDNPELLEV